MYTGSYVLEVVVRLLLLIPTIRNACGMGIMSVPTLGSPGTNGDEKRFKVS